MEKTTLSITINIEKELKKSFAVICKIKETNMTDEIIKFIQNFIKEKK